MNTVLSQRQLNVRGYQCSPNLRYVLFQHNIKEVRTYWAVKLLIGFLQNKQDGRYEVCALESTMLFEFYYLQVYHRTFTAHYTVYDVTNEWVAFDIWRLSAAKVAVAVKNPRFS